MHRRKKQLKLWFSAWARHTGHLKKFNNKQKVNIIELQSLI